jgi:hypothetical protein
MMTPAQQQQMMHEQIQRMQRQDDYRQCVEVLNPTPPRDATPIETFGIVVGLVICVASMSSLLAAAVYLMFKVGK